MLDNVIELMLIFFSVIDIMFMRRLSLGNALFI